MTQHFKQISVAGILMLSIGASIVVILNLQMDLERIQVPWGHGDDVDPFYVVYGWPAKALGKLVGAGNSDHWEIRSVPNLLIDIVVALAIFFAIFLIDRLVVSRNRKQPERY